MIEPVKEEMVKRRKIRLTYLVVFFLIGLSLKVIHCYIFLIILICSFKSTGDRKQQIIEQSKYLGGDLKHTHLVKGLDYALLQKIRAEQARKEEEEMKMAEEILDAKAKSDRKLEDKEDLMALRHPLAKNISRVLFETDIPKCIENFLEGNL